MTVTIYCPVAIYRHFSTIGRPGARAPFASCPTARNYLSGFDWVARMLRIATDRDIISEAGNVGAISVTHKLRGVGSSPQRSKVMISVITKRGDAMRGSTVMLDQVIC